MSVYFAAVIEESNDHSRIYGFRCSSFFLVIRSCDSETMHLASQSHSRMVSQFLG